MSKPAGYVQDLFYYLSSWVENSKFRFMVVCPGLRRKEFFAERFAAENYLARIQDKIKQKSPLLLPSLVAKEFACHGASFGAGYVLTNKVIAFIKEKRERLQR